MEVNNTKAIALLGILRRKAQTPNQTGAQQCERQQTKPWQPAPSGLIKPAWRSKTVKPLPAGGPI